MQAHNNSSSKYNPALSLGHNTNVFSRRLGGLARVAGIIGIAASILAPGAQASASVAQALPASGAPTGSQYFSVTGKSVRGEFLGAFNRFGLKSIGYPVSDERQENGLTVQYFERVRMEYHPETAGAGFPVLMTRLGAELSKPAQPFTSVAPFASTASRAYLRQTGHSLSEPFLSYWKNNGGLELFGYPISEPVTQDGMQVQWFERARFEYHPELQKSGHAVELSLLGKSAYDKAAPAPAVLQTKPQAQLASSVKQSPASAPAQNALSEKESYLLKSINEQRAAAGLGAVQVDPTVTEVARARSSDMAKRNYFSHTTPEGTQFFSMLADHNISYRWAGEILARNNYPDDQAAQVAMTSYLNSAPHKAIIMDGRYGSVGIGYSKAADGMHYFAVLFIQK